MKEKQRNKPNSYGKLTKRMLISLGIGGVFGCFAGIFMTFGVKNGMSDLSDLVRPLALPIIAVIFVVSIVLMEFYSRKLKDTMKHLEEAEDEQYEVLSYEEEKYGAMLMNCNGDFAGLRYHRADIYLFPFLAGRSIGKRARRIPGNLCSVLYQLLSLWLLSDALCKNGSGSSPGEERRYELKKLPERLDGKLR